MRRTSRFGWRKPLKLGLPLLGIGLATYVRFEIMRTLKDDRGYERSLRRWLPVATEFRARQLRLASALIWLSQSASRVGLLSSSGERAVATRVVRLVRFEARPVYSSGNYGEWGDTGIRWQFGQPEPAMAAIANGLDSDRGDRASEWA